MNKTLWDYCLENGWKPTYEVGKGDEDWLRDSNNEFFIHINKYHYRIVGENPIYADPKPFSNKASVWAEIIIGNSLPLDKQINLLNAFIEAYS